MFLADAPQKPEINTTKTIMVQTTHGQVFLSPVFTIEPHCPISGFIKIYDSPSDATYWFNQNEIVWIGPR